MQSLLPSNQPPFVGSDLSPNGLQKVISRRHWQVMIKNKCALNACDTFCSFCSFFARRMFFARLLFVFSPGVFFSSFRPNIIIPGEKSKRRKTPGVKTKQRKYTKRSNENEPHEKTSNKRLKLRFFAWRFFFFFGGGGGGVAIFSCSFFRLFTWQTSL